MCNFNCIVYNGDLMKTISLCMIVKNEEKKLNKCLSSVKDIVDEIIIVDTGSNDKTIEIAKKYTDKIYHFDWINDFAAARNYSLSFATKDYIMWLDADDYIKKSQKEKIKMLKQSDDTADMYYFLYDFNDNYQAFYRERMFLRSMNYRFKGKIHEAIIPSGNVKYMDIVINQQNIEKGLNRRNIDIFESLKSEEFTSRDYYYYAKELLRHNEKEKAILYLNKYINLSNTYYEDKIDSLFLLGNLYSMKQEYTLALETYFKSFNVALPRPNILCEIANIYFINGFYNEAIYYYKLALNSLNIPKTTFIHKDYLGYLPAIQLCVCYDKLKEYKMANKYNELAYKYKKNKEIYQFNKQYFKEKLNKM